MTKREIAHRRRIKKELIEKGVLPPPKPKLNRKKFVESAIEEWNSKDNANVWYLYFYDAMAIMLGHFDKNYRTSLEAVGVAKVIKIAMRLQQFSEKLKKERRTKYTLGEQMEYIKDIFEA